MACAFRRRLVKRLPAGLFRPLLLSVADSVLVGVSFSVGLTMTARRLKKKKNKKNLARLVKLLEFCIRIVRWASWYCILE